jgi:hypothetical protein
MPALLGEDPRDQPLVPSRGMVLHQSQASRAADEVTPNAPPLDDVEHRDPLPQEQAPPPVMQAPQAQDHPFVNPGAVLGEPPTPAAQQDMSTYSVLHENKDGLLDNYRQDEPAQPSPVGNGQVGDANQIDHRPGADGLVEGQVMYGGFAYYQAVFYRDGGVPLAMDWNNLPDLEGLAPLQFRGDEVAGDGPNFNYDPPDFGGPVPFGAPDPFDGPDHFGFDDMGFM